MSGDKEFSLISESEWKLNQSFADFSKPGDVIWGTANESWTNESLADTTEPTVENKTIPYYLYVYVTSSIFYGIVFIFGVIGNILVIYVILKNSDMLTATNLFLMNLSIADLLVLLICMPSSLSEFLAKDVWLLGAVMCKLVAHLELAVAHTSILTILAISFERYYAICCPLKVLYTCTKRRAIKILVCVWLFGISSAIPIMLMTYTEETSFYTGDVVTICRSHINTALKKSYIVAVLILFFAVPFLFLVVLYAFICRQLLKDETGMDGRRNRQRLVHMGQSSNSEEYRRSNSRQRKRTLNSRKQVIYMLITIIMLFFICLLPMKVVSTLLVFSTDEDLAVLGLEAYLNLLSFSRILFYINSAVNPILYNIVSTKFRDACRRSIACTPESERRRQTRSFMFYSSSSQRRVVTKTANLNFDHDFEDNSSACRNNSVAFSVTAVGDTTVSLLNTDLNSIVKNKGETFI